MLAIAGDSLPFRSPATGTVARPIFTKSLLEGFIINSPAKHYANIQFGGTQGGENLIYLALVIYRRFLGSAIVSLRGVESKRLHRNADGAGFPFLSRCDRCAKFRPSLGAI